MQTRYLSKDTINEMCFHVCVKAKEREGKWECVCVNKDNSSRHNVQCMVVQQVVPHILSKLQPLLCYLMLRPLYLFLCLPYLITLAPPPFRSHCPSLQVLTQGCWWYLLSGSQCTYGFGWVDTMGGLTTYCGGSVAPETHDQNTAGQCQKNTGMLEAVKEKLSMKK